MVAASVAHIITKLELGGAQQNTLFTVSHLDTTRFRPILITGEPGVLDQEARALEGVSFHQIPSLVRPVRPLRDGLALLLLTTLLRRLKPEIVHTHSSKAGVLGRLAAWAAGVPIIIHTIHGFGFTRYQHALHRWILIASERLVSRLTTRFFCVSEASRRTGIELGLFSPERSTVIRSGVDLAAFRREPADREAKRRELGCEPGQSLVGMVAPLKPQKAPVDFVRVAKVVHRKFPGARFVLVGDGELRPAVEAEVQRLGLQAVFRLAGWRRNIAEVLHCLDVFVLTSLWEGLPRVYLEALSASVPVVGTRVDGATEVIEDGVNGFLAEPGDIQTLADRVMRLLAEEEERRTMSERGRTLPGQFDITEMVRQQEQEYDRLLMACDQRRLLSEPSACGTGTDKIGE